MSIKPMYLIRHKDSQLDTPKASSTCKLFDQIFSLSLMALAAPVLVCNTLLALMAHQPILTRVHTRDCLNRTVNYYEFSCGLFTKLPILWAIFTKKLRFCGMPMRLKLTVEQQLELSAYHAELPGLVDGVSVQRLTGLKLMPPVESLKKQFSQSRAEYISLLIRGTINHFLYSQNRRTVANVDSFSIFGFTVNNVSMQQAITWITGPSNKKQGCKVGCFLNVNSINLSTKHPDLVTAINATDRCFADGSGVRLAAKKVGVNIKENVNGTDLMPHLCQAAKDKGLSIYLLGAQEGVAEKTAQNLTRLYPGLLIAGYQHGFFEPSESTQVVNQINHSGADILLLAMGSPLQESWLVEYAPSLNCQAALAVGGLFDFYSGNISRAPIWMREMGLEWVWRLLQEPKSKFNRYVIGNPLFLFRTFVLGHAKKGA